jgi:hypothetical protein
MALVWLVKHRASGSAILALGCALLAACGAGDNRLDPGDLELRDVLGISPETASSWDRDQRASARRVIDDGLHHADASPIRASLGAEAVLDRRVAKALASVDADRARHDTGALGLVRVAIGPSELTATTRFATIVPQSKRAVEIRLEGWDAEPALSKLPARGLDVVAAIATDAGHTSGPIVVTPAPHLSVVAGYVPATSTEPARLVINPVVLAALEPEGGVTTTQSVAVERAQPASPAKPPVAPTQVAAANPYSFYGSVGECAAAQSKRCTACVANGSCTPITDIGDGNDECTQLGANDGRGFFLICINLALAIDSVSTCTAGSVPSCPRDTRASESISSLENNANFLDDPQCGNPLDVCLATIFGSPRGPFPGPGSGSGSTLPPRDTSAGCDDWADDANCDPNCELDGPSCDDSESSDGGCSSSDDQSSGCDGSSGGDSGGGDCGDSEDSCGSSDNSSCDSGDGGDCGGGDSGGDCGGGGGGGDCGGGGGGDCGGGGGGDCGGGGGDCNAAGKRGHHGGGGGLIIAVMWAFLPVPFATFVRRRAVRKRAWAEHDDSTDEVSS